MMFNLLPISCDDHACDMEIKFVTPCLSDSYEITSRFIMISSVQTWNLVGWSCCYLIKYYAIKLENLELLVDCCGISRLYIYVNFPLVFLTVLTDY